MHHNTMAHSAHCNTMQYHAIPYHGTWHTALAHKPVALPPPAPVAPQPSISSTINDAINSLGTGYGTGARIPILVLCHNRPAYLERTLDALLKYAAESLPCAVSSIRSVLIERMSVDGYDRNRPSKDRYPIIVSQDGDHQQVWDMITNKYADSVVGIQVCNLYHDTYTHKHKYRAS
jgi:hypothetical protein